MQRVNLSFNRVLVLAVLASFPALARAQSAFQPLTGKAFDSALPRDFYLEGNAIPTEKRNAVLLKTPAGARLLVALIDTSGYSSQIQQKYIGMLIAESTVSVCAATVGVGSYGFGLERPGHGSAGEAKLFLYNQAGDKIGECTAQSDGEMKTPRPLQVVLDPVRPARLYLGRYWLELK